MAIHDVDLGPIRLCVAQLARVAGARLVVRVDPLAHCRLAGLSPGVDVVLDPTYPDYAADLGVASGPGVDVAIEAAGETLPSRPRCRSFVPSIS